MDWEFGLRVLLEIFIVGGLSVLTVLVVHLTTGPEGEGYLLLSCLYAEGQPQATCDSVALPPCVNLRRLVALKSYVSVHCRSGRVYAHG